MDADVVVVGAGLAGLRCALDLHRSGLEVLVVEASDGVGGRIRTDHVDGFLVDRGFQLLNPAYPAVRRDVDVDALGLQPFGAGVAARVDGDDVVRLGHPVRAPWLLGETTAVALRRPREVAQLVRWAAPLLTPRVRRPLSDVVAGRPERVTPDGLLGRVLERFLAGVLLEDDGSTADAYTLLLTWMFVRGVPGLPRDGMQALPEQLAASLGARVRLGTPVERVTSRAVLTAGGAISARAVVVAVGAEDAPALTGVPEVATKGVVTTWWAADDVPERWGLLHVDARTRPRGPLVNCAVVSQAAPTYAPLGRHLVQGSALLADDDGEPAARRHAADLLGVDAGRWQVVARHVVPHALPAQPPPFSTTRPVALGERRFVCGDHRDTGSIQGALVSGRRAADAVRAALA